VFAFNSCGLPFFYWVKIQICKIKAEYEEGDRDRSTTSFTVFSANQAGVQRVGNDELLVAGKMYDIVKTQTRNGVKYYYAANDNDEDTYISKLADAEKSAAQETSQPIKASKLHEAKYFARDNDHHFICSSSITTVNDIVVNDSPFYPLDFRDIFTPPPESSFS